MELGANNLIDAITKMREHSDSAKICLTSVDGEFKARKIAAEMAHYGGIPNEYREHLQFMGITIIGREEVESDHAFFFATVEDMNEFLESVREMRAEGMDWNDFVRWFEYNMRRTYK